MTYMEHDRDCRIFKDARAVFGGGTCNCGARFARAPIIMGPHEQFCPYLDQRPREVMHGICYCSANPRHDQDCLLYDNCPFWQRRLAALDDVEKWGHHETLPRPKYTTTFTIESVSPALFEMLTGRKMES